MKVTLTKKEAQAIMLEAVSAKLGLGNQRVAEMRVSSYDDREYLKLELEDASTADESETNDKPTEEPGEE